MMNHVLERRDMEAERAISRGGFVRRLGTLAAIGLGVALVPSQQAQAAGA